MRILNKKLINEIINLVIDIDYKVNMFGVYDEEIRNKSLKIVRILKGGRK